VEEPKESMLQPVDVNLVSLTKELKSVENVDTDVLNVLIAKIIVLHVSKEEKLSQIVIVLKDSMMINPNQHVNLVTLNVSLVSELQISVPGVSVKEKTPHLVLLVQLANMLTTEKLIVKFVLLNVLLVLTLKPTVSNVPNTETKIHQSVLKIVSLFIVNAIILEKCSKSVMMMPTSMMVEFGKNQSDLFTSLKD
jgi:hypothetical protein